MKFDYRLEYSDQWLWIKFLREALRGGHNFPISAADEALKAFKERNSHNKESK